MEVKKRIRVINFKRALAVAAICMFIAGGIYGQQDIKPRVDGLERDSVYMSLLVQERALKNTEDSLNMVIASLREQFSSDTTARAERGRQLIAMETSLFEVKTKIGRIVSRTNAIEQQAVLGNMGSFTQAAPPSAHGYSGLDEYFKKNLPAEEFSQLEVYRDSEPELDSLAGRYAATYRKITAISLVYDTISSPRASDSLYNVYRFLRDEIYDMEEQLNGRWGEAVSNSIYIYSLLLDKLDKMDEIEALYEKGRNAVVDTDGVMSPAFAEYPIQKSLLLSYKISLASILGLATEEDSLKALQKEVEKERFDFPVITLVQKDHVNFSKVEKSSNPDIYGLSNPIPRLWIPDYGTYYGVMVGTFSSAQQGAIFRGFNPVFVERLRTGQYRYYVGLYRTLGEAYESSLMLAREGFRRPEVVVWRDGEYENLAEAIAGNAGLFSVKIKGAGSEAERRIKYAVEKYGRGKDVVRAGDTYSVGIFANRLHAQELAGALSSSEGVEVSIEEIEQTE